MLKVYDYAVTFAEFPDEIALCLNISNCPNRCEGCSEPWLRGDTGVELTDDYILQIIEENQDVTLIGIMGGDNDPEDRVRVAKFIKEHSDLKVGIYSGADHIYNEGLQYIDLYKIGRWIFPFDETGNVYQDKQCGPINTPITNQKMFEIKGKYIEDITYKMQKNKVSEIKNFVIRGENT